MKLKVPVAIVLLGLIVIVLNHHVMDWKSITSGKIEKSFTQLIGEQRKDLNSWKAFEPGDTRFQKRRFCDEKVVSWSDNKPWVAEPVVKDIQVVETNEGTYLIQTIVLNKNCRKTSVYPLKKEYEISNKFIRSRMDVSLPRNLMNVSGKEGSFHYKNLFYFDLKESPSKSIDAIAGIIIISALLWLAWEGLSLFFYPALGVLLLARAISLYFNTLDWLFKYPLFDSLIYKSSSWNPTLGDLFVNCLLLFLITITWSRKFRKEEVVAGKYQLYLFLTFGVLFSVSVHTTIWSILDNSQLSLDVGKSIHFDFRRIIALISILFVASSQFLVTFRCVGLLNATSNKSSYYLFLLLLSGVGFLISQVVGAIALLFLFIIFVSNQLNWTNKLKQYRYQNLQFVLFVSVSVAVVLSRSVYEFHEKSELDTKRKFANYLLIKRDVLSEYYLNQLLKEIEEIDFQGISRKDASERIANRFVNPYLDKYNIQIIDPVIDSLSYYEVMPSLTRETLS
ncbi:MAG: hypothetical protein AAGA66_18865, partial [Bacteroidota bacterium]